MTFDEYVNESKRTATALSDDNRKEQMVMSGLGITGEAGEVADEIKKHVFHGHTLDEIKIMKELGDVLWYMARLCAILNVSLDTVAQMNIDKLKARYPNGFERERSINRTEG